MEKFDRFLLLMSPFFIFLRLITRIQSHCLSELMFMHICFKVVCVCSSHAHASVQWGLEMVSDPLELQVIVSHLLGTESRSSERPSNTFKPLYLLSSSPYGFFNFTSPRVHSFLLCIFQVALCGLETLISWFIVSRKLKFMHMRNAFVGGNILFWRRSCRCIKSLRFISIKQNFWWWCWKQHLIFDYQDSKTVGLL